MQAFGYFVAPRTIERTRAQIVLPAFTLDVPLWAGASAILSEAPISNANEFSLKLPIDAFGENFIAAIRWMDGDVYVRYILFNHNDAVLNYPLYNGERIGANATIEIWSVDSLSAPVLEDDYTFYSSELVYPVSQTGYSVPCCSSPSSVTTLSYTAPSTLPPGSPCNPFCGDLCNTADPMPACDCPTVVFANVTDARAYAPAAFVVPSILFTQGGASPGDGLGKDFNWDAASLDVDTGLDDTTVIRPDSINAAAPGRWVQRL